MADVFDRRRKALRLLIAQWGTPSALAQHLGLAGPSYLSQLTHGHRPVTEKTARKFEQLLDLPTGWMDLEHKAREQPVALDTSLVARCAAVVSEMSQESGIKLQAEKFGDVVALLYADATHHSGQVREDYVRQLLQLAR